MIRVWLAQCKCQNGHAIMAAAGEADETTAREHVLDPFIRQVIEMIDNGSLNPWCGLCKAKASGWVYELGRTAWTSMVEAMPSLAQSEAEQIATGVLFGELGDEKGSTH